MAAARSFGSPVFVFVAFTVRPVHVYCNIVESSMWAIRSLVSCETYRIKTTHLMGTSTRAVSPVREDTVEIVEGEVGQKERTEPR